MEITSSNDGLLTNIEVYNLIDARRQERVENRTIAIELQNRERIEIQVFWKLKCYRIHTSTRCIWCLTQSNIVDIFLRRSWNI